MQEPAEDGLGDGIVVRTIAEALFTAAVDYWWLWLLFLVLIVAAARFSTWSRRLDARARAEQRARERAERELDR